MKFYDNLPQKNPKKKLKDEWLASISITIIIETQELIKYDSKKIECRSAWSYKFYLFTLGLKTSQLNMVDIEYINFLCQMLCHI